MMLFAQIVLMVNTMQIIKILQELKKMIVQNIFATMDVQLITGVACKLA
jgi:hypothetical protein